MEATPFLALLALEAAAAPGTPLQETSDLHPTDFTASLGAKSLKGARRLERKPGTVSWCVLRILAEDSRVSAPSACARTSARVARAHASAQSQARMHVEADAHLLYPLLFSRASLLQRISSQHSNEKLIRYICEHSDAVVRPTRVACRGLRVACGSAAGRRGYACSHTHTGTRAHR